MSVRRILETALAAKPDPKPATRTATTRQITAAEKALERAELRLRKVTLAKTADPQSVALAQQARDEAASRLAELTGTDDAAPVSVESQENDEPQATDPAPEAAQAVAGLIQAQRDAPTIGGTPKAKRARRKAAAADLPRETLTDLNARIAEQRAETDRLSAEFDALTDQQRQQRIAEHLADADRRTDEARRRSRERYARSIADLPEDERAALLAQRDTDAREWESRIAAMAEAGHVPESETGSRPEYLPGYDAPLAPSVSPAQFDALLADQRGGGSPFDALRRFVTAPDQQESLPPTPQPQPQPQTARRLSTSELRDAITNGQNPFELAFGTTAPQASTDPMAALREQAAAQRTARDAAVRAERAAERPLNTAEGWAEAARWDTARYADAEQTLRRIETSRLGSVAKSSSIEGGREPTLNCHRAIG